jgi:predicted ester cyclase
MDREALATHHTDLPVNGQQVHTALNLLLHMGQGRAGRAQAPQVSRHPITYEQ